MPRAFSGSIGSRRRATGRSRRSGWSSGVYDAPVVPEIGGRARRMVAQPSPVEMIFLDLPLLTGEEGPHSPHVAVVAKPWTGPVAVVFGEPGLRLRLQPETAAAGGHRDAARSAAGRAAPGSGCRARSGCGSRRGRLQSRERGRRAERRQRGGACARPVAATGRSSSSRPAELIGAAGISHRRLSCADRPAPTGSLPETWPAGTDFVLLDGAVGQLDLPASARGSSGTIGSGRRRRPTTIRASSTGSRPFAASGCGRIAPAHLAADDWRMGDSRSAGCGARGSTATAGPASTCRSARSARPIWCASSVTARCFARWRRAPRRGATRPTIRRATAAGGRLALRGGAGLGPLRSGTLRKDRDSMARTAQLGLPLVMPAQAQKHVTVNEALVRLDAAAQLRVISSVVGEPARVGGGRRRLPRAGRRDRRLGGHGRTDRGLEQRRLDFSRAEGWLAGLGRGPGRAPHVRRRSAGCRTRVAVSRRRRRAHLAGHRVRPRDQRRRRPTRRRLQSRRQAQVIGVTGRVIAAIAGPGLSGWRIGVAGSGDRYGSGLGTAAQLLSRSGSSGAPGDLLCPDAAAALGGRRQPSRPATIRLAIHLVELVPPREV